MHRSNGSRDNMGGVDAPQGAIKLSKRSKCYQTLSTPSFINIKQDHCACLPISFKLIKKNNLLVIYSSLTYAERVKGQYNYSFLKMPFHDIQAKYLLVFPNQKSLKNYGTTSKCMDPLTPLTLIYDSVTLPIMCKCMYRKSSRKIARVNTALNDLQLPKRTR